MSKLILKKEIKKLYLNTVLKIFIRQYRTRAGNHCNCCSIIFFQNVLDYVFMQKLFFKLHSCFTVLGLRKPTPNRRVCRAWELF